MRRPVREQVVVVTGASSGIGRETALELARRGAKVVLAARSEEALCQVGRQIEDLGGEAQVVVTDVARWEQVHHLAQSAVERFGRIDTWVNNAAVSEYAPVEQMTVEEIDRIIQVDLLGPIYGCKAVIPYMRHRGGGTIINVGSALSERAVPLQSIYSTAKHGLKGFTEALRIEMELEKTNVRVTLILPSSINTPFYDHARSPSGRKPQPIGPVYEPAAVAKAIVYAAEHPRRDIYVGAAGKMLSMLEQVGASLVDKYMTGGGRIKEQMLGGQGDNQKDNLFAAGNGSSSSRGRHGQKAHGSSLYTSMFELHPAAKRLVVAVATLGAVAVVSGLTRTGKRRAILEKVW